MNKDKLEIEHSDAFYAYRDFKYKRVKEIIDYYKKTYNLPQKIYDAILNYKIEIID